MINYIVGDGLASRSRVVVAEEELLALKRIKSMVVEEQSLTQSAKKVVSDSPGLVDFAIGLVNSVFNLPDGQVMFFEELE